MPGISCRPVAAVSTLLLAMLGFAAAAHAQPPSITGLSPQAVRPGDTIDVTIRGGALAGAAALWTSFPAEAVLSPDVADNGTNEGEVVFRIAVPADVHPGVHGLRVVTERGVSPIRLCVVDDLPTVPQEGNNTSPSAAQAVPPLTAVDGAINPLTLHYYKFPAEAGQRISFEVLARRIGSALDPMIRILDSSGRELAYSDDAPGLSADSQLSYTFEEAGEYTLEVRDIRYQGGGNHFYRLRIGDFPCLTVPHPMGVQRGTQATLSFAGTDVDDVVPLALAVPTDPNVQWMTVGARRADGQSSGFVSVSVGDGAEFVEVEPNDQPEQANRVELGTHLNGRLDEPGDVDRFVFAARQGEAWRFEAVTRQQGSPSDLYLQLFHPNGSRVAEADDNPPLDGMISYTFPEDGDYTLVVEDLHRRGGAPFAYRIAVSPGGPGFSLAASAHALNLPAEGTTHVTVTAARRDYNGPIELAAEGLPPGAASARTVIGPGMNQAVLTITGSPDAPAGQLFGARIVGRARIGENDVAATASVAGSLKETLQNMPWPPLPLSESLAAAAAPASPLVLRAEPAELVFGKSLSATVKVTADRKSDAVDQAVALAVTPQQNGLPPGVTAAVNPIAEGSQEVEVVFSANDQAPLGEFTAVLLGTHAKDNVTITQAVPGITLKLQAPFELALDVGEGQLAKGGELKLKVTAARNPAFAGEIALSFQNLPAGVTASAATIPADQTEIEVTLTAAEDAAAASADNVTVTGEGTAGEAKVTAVSPAATLAVE